MFPGKGYNETAVGDSFTTSMTVTETHLVLAAGMFGDFNPLHVDEAHAAKARLGGRVLHGGFTSALMAAVPGMYFHATAIAYLEHACRFKAPVRPGDTLTTTWTVTDRIDKPQHDGGIVVMTAQCRNQDGTLVADADGKMLAMNKHGG